MAETSWPDTTHNNRAVTDVEYEQLAGSAYAEGFTGSPYDPTPAYGAGGLAVKMRANRYALVRGHVWSSGPTDLSYTITSNASGSTRYDLLVLRLDRSTWTVRAVVKAGAGTSVNQLTRNTGTTGLFEIPVAVVTVRSGATGINSGDVANVAYYVQPQSVVLPSGANYRWVPTDVARSFYAVDSRASSVWNNNGGWDQTLTGSSGVQLVASKTIPGFAYNNDYRWLQIMSLTYYAYASLHYEVKFDCQFLTGDSAASRAPTSPLAQVYDNGYSICHSGIGGIVLSAAGTNASCHIEGQVTPTATGNRTLTVYAGRGYGGANFDIGRGNNGGVPTWLRVYCTGSRAF